MPKEKSIVRSPEESTTPTSLAAELEEMKKSTAVYLRRFKREKRERRRLQEELDLEKRRVMQMEEALRMTSAETLKRITESLAATAKANAAKVAAGKTSSDEDEDKDDVESGNLSGDDSVASPGVPAHGGGGPRASSPKSGSAGESPLSSGNGINSSSDGATHQLNAKVSATEAADRSGSATPPRGECLLSLSSSSPVTQILVSVSVIALVQSLAYTWAPRESHR